jgi:hypothetical protein
MTPALTRRQQRVYELYFGRGLTQAQVARETRRKQPAVSRVVGRIRSAFRVAGITPPPRPGTGLQLVPTLSTSGAWDRAAGEYAAAAI